MSPRAALSGSLDELPLPELLPFLGIQGRTGVLECGGGRAGRLVLVDGSLVLGLTDDGPSLREAVLGSGIAEADRWAAAQREIQQGTPAADALVGAGVDDDALRGVLCELTVDAVFELHLGSGVTFDFLDGASHAIGGRHRFAPGEILDEAVRRVAAWREYAEVIPSTDLVFRLAHDLPGPVVSISADDWRVLARVDGRTTVAEIVEALGSGAFAVYGTLVRLARDGAVEATP